MAKELSDRLKEHHIELVLTDAAKEKVAEKGYDPEYGARPLRRSIQKNIEDRLSEEMLKGNIKEGQKVLVDVKDGEFTFASVAESEAVSSNS
jgi:ATP-dependent Clp protease ATP-binding subunit ClpC